MNEEKLLQAISSMMDERFTQMEERLDTRIGKLEGEVKSLRTEVNDLRTEVNDLRTEVNDLRTEVNNLRTEVNDLRTEMNAGFEATNKAISDLQFDTGSIVTQIGEMLDDKLSALRHELEWTKNATAQNSMDIAALKISKLQ